MPISKQLDLLEELQKIDLGFEHIKNIRGELPEQIKELKEDFELKDANLNALKSQLEVVAKSQRKIQVDIDICNEKIKKYQAQRYEVSTNKEYEAINTEVEMQEQKIEDLEKQILDLIAEEEEVKKEIEELEADVKIIKQEIGEKEKELSETDEKSIKEEKKLRKMREKLVLEIDPKILRKYTRVAKTNNKIGVARITKSACGACFRKLMPQIVVDVRAMDRYIFCVSCSAILLPEIENEEE